MTSGTLLTTHASDKARVVIAKNHAGQWRVQQQEHMQVGAGEYSKQVVLITYGRW